MEITRSLNIAMIGAAFFFIGALVTGVIS